MEREDKLLTIEEVCERLRCKRQHLYALWNRGEGPIRTRIAGIKIRESDLDEWIESRKELPGQKDGDE